MPEADSRSEDGRSEGSIPIERSLDEPIQLHRDVLMQFRRVDPDAKASASSASAASASLGASQFQLQLDLLAEAHELEVMQLERRIAELQSDTRSPVMQAGTDDSELVIQTPRLPLPYGRQSGWLPDRDNLAETSGRLSATALSEVSVTSDSVFAPKTSFHKQKSFTSTTSRNALLRTQSNLSLGWCGQQSEKHFEVLGDWQEYGVLEDRIMSTGVETLTPSLLTQRSFTPQTKDLHLGSLEHFRVPHYCSCPIPPMSRRRLGWMMISAWLLLYDVLMVPLGVFELDEDNSFFAVMEYLICIFWTLDILMSFSSGFIDKGKVVLDMKTICRSYLKSWFAFDFLLVSLDWIFILSRKGTGSKSNSLADVGAVAGIMRVLRIMRLLRILKARHLMAFLMDLISSEYTHLLFQLVKLVLSLLLLSHVMACLWYEIGKNGWVELFFSIGPPAGTGYRYATCLHWVLAQFTPGQSEIFPVNTLERACGVFFMLTGLIIFSSVVSSITQTVLRIHNITADTSQQFWKLRRFLQERHVSAYLMNRINRYLEHVFEEKSRHAVQENGVELLSVLSSQLYQELQYEVRKQQLTVHPFLDWICVISNITMMRICKNSLELKNLASTDHLTFIAERGTHMYIIVGGELCYSGVPTTGSNQNNAPKGMRFSNRNAQSMLDESNDACKLSHSGPAVCEPVLWLSRWLHHGELYAVSEVECLAFSAQEFPRALKQNPHMFAEAKRFAAKFVDCINQMSPADVSDLLHSKLMGTHHPNSDVFNVDALVLV